MKINKSTLFSQSVTLLTRITSDLNSTQWREKYNTTFCRQLVLDGHICNDIVIQIEKCVCLFVMCNRFSNRFVVQLFYATIFDATIDRFIEKSSWKLLKRFDFTMKLLKRKFLFVEISVPCTKISQLFHFKFNIFQIKYNLLNLKSDNF